jgi:hypothetical protein
MLVAHQALIVYQQALCPQELQTSSLLFKSLNPLFSSQLAVFINT